MVLGRCPASIFIGFIHILLQLSGQLEQVVRVALQLSLTLAVRLLGHVFFELYPGFVFAVAGVGPRAGASWNRDGVLTERWQRRARSDKKKQHSQREGFESHSDLGKAE